MSESSDVYIYYGVSGYYTGIARYNMIRSLFTKDLSKIVEFLKAAELAGNRVPTHLIAQLEDEMMWG